MPWYGIHHATDFRVGQARQGAIGKADKQESDTGQTLFLLTVITLYSCKVLSETSSLVLVASHSNPYLPGPMCNPCSWQTAVAPCVPAKTDQGSASSGAGTQQRCFLGGGWAEGTEEQDKMWGDKKGRSLECGGGEQGLLRRRGPMLLSIQMPMSLPVSAWTWQRRTLCPFGSCRR